MYTEIILFYTFFCGIFWFFRQTALFILADRKNSTLQSTKNIENIKTSIIIHRYLKYIFENYFYVYYIGQYFNILTKNHINSAGIKSNQKVLKTKIKLKTNFLCFEYIFLFYFNLFFKVST